MSSIITSDLHLGSGFCKYDRLQAWIEALPDGPDLVLNGDVVHVRRPGFIQDHLRLLDTLREMAATRRVIWVAGNHDAECTMDDPGGIEFVRSHTIGGDLAVVHGHTFETRNLLTGICFSLFRSLYRLHLAMGGPQMHVARYARSFPLLFRVFRNGVSSNAVRYARRHCCHAIACGHTHYAEDVMIDGVRYINTGSWTEEPFYSLFVDEGVMELKTHE